MKNESNHEEATKSLRTDAFPAILPQGMNSDLILLHYRQLIDRMLSTIAGLTTNGEGSYPRVQVTQPLAC
jgi:hypothetical protein